MRNSPEIVEFTVPDRPAAVVGAGTMGRRIALMLAARGGEVRILDPSAEQRAAAAGFVTDQLPQVAADIPGGAPGTVVPLEDLADAVRDTWLVVEAIPERLDLKRDLFAELGRTAPEDAILASNSSSYSTRLFADAVTVRPERVVNTHFFTQLPACRIVEVMSSGTTDPDVMKRLMTVLPEFGLRPYEVRGESTGFIFNRIWAAIKRESLMVAAEGVATPEDVDEIFRDTLGTPVGPFRAMDQVGLDVVLDVEEHYAKERPGTPEGPRQLLRMLLDQGYLGAKSGRGFYSYDG
ncbi:3-hydroxyacyl-CoA dehydrogenase family protein [Streptomyces graminilatus]|uniref:3-hydroxyacyl-CoA dehydrogenase family protein n=1 Tax=Streptomyces graminilatus TaxID=1464070 RepID=UPI0006E17345|nr:3-hydroxyacyl-CoA dehydrogenase family protein [Streptomyces graminilatus]